MAILSNPGDSALLELLRVRGALTIAQLMAGLEVTATAVRQRLSRLMASGFVIRQVTRPTRGRPSHCYSLTDKGRRQGGSNFNDLAMVLWQEVRAIKDPAVRSGLLTRIAKTMASSYIGQTSTGTASERMEAVQRLFAERNVPLEVDNGGELPVLTALACPYPELAEQDRGICAVERMLFSELVGERMRLAECRLDGASSCRFETSPRVAPPMAASVGPLAAGEIGLPVAS